MTTTAAAVASAAPASAEDLHGTWTLASFTQTIVATGETIDVFGKSPCGFITYGRDGRMLVLVVKDERPCPSDLASITDNDRAELFRTMIAYGGTYSFDGLVVTHHLDISWNQVFTGADQVRNVEFVAGRFVMSTNPQPRSQDGQVAVSVLTWERLN